MGLAIDVGHFAFLKKHDAEGAQWFQKRMAVINEVLKTEGLPAFEEPETLPKLVSRAACESFPYSFIHYLRRIYANILEEPDWVMTPNPEGVDAASDEAIMEQVCMLSSHLLCHSDAEGDYLPIEFDDPIFDERFPGGMLGSSVMLMKELALVTPWLSIQLDESGGLSDEEANRVNQLASEDGPCHREYCVWIALYEACRLSIEHQTCITFC